MTIFTRTLLCAVGVTATALTVPTTAGAASGHTSCKALGALVASEAQAGTIDDENRALPHGTIDDLLHIVQVGGVFGGEPIPPFCELK